MNYHILVVLALFSVACSPVKTQITEQYRLTSYSSLKPAHPSERYSILVTTPKAAAGFQTEQMLYTIKPFELASFSHNAWVSPPAEMMQPLIAESLERSGYFKAVVSDHIGELTDYKIDVQLIELKQNFLQNPVKLDFVAKAVLTRVKDNRVLTSKMFRYAPVCPSKNPFGGVVAANEAMKHFTADLSAFIIAHLHL